MINELAAVLLNSDKDLLADERECSYDYELNTNWSLSNRRAGIIH